jgi:selenide,water dikinase
MPDRGNGHDEKIRCGGCGAKVGARALGEVLQRLAEEDATGINPSAEDAAIITPPAGQVMLQSVDFFRAFIDDPYLVGKIAANHCLGDIYAMGARPASALAVASVPFSHPRIMQDTLYQLLRGALATLQPANVSLLGGHSSEAAELAFGLTVNGFSDGAEPLTKAGLRAGQALILSKPLGTGTLLAANMLHRARGSWIEVALEVMQQSNLQAALIMRQHGASACTDITGFGLLGHLLEMLQASGARACLTIDAIPLLPGARECLEQGWLSTLHGENAWHQQQLNRKPSACPASEQILYDPQTAGGLLFAIPAKQTAVCLDDLQRAGYQAACIGEVCPGDAANPALVTLL